jgi:hypothetical protein
MVPVPTRKVSCRLVTTYAGFEGESVLLQEVYQRGLEQPQIGPSLYAGDGLLMFWSHEPVAPWQDERWLAEMRRSLRPAQYLRMIENRFVTSESCFIDLAAWDACVDPSATPVLADKALPLWVGVDASVKHDSTAIVAVTWEQIPQRVRLVWQRVFQPTPDDPLSFEDAIERTLLDLHNRFRVIQVLFDPWQMQATAQRLARAGLRVEEFPQSPGNLTVASQNLYELIEGHNLITYPDVAMRLAVSRAVALETSRGWRIAKEKQSHKIDVVVALAMAAHAAVKSPTIAPVLWRREALLFNERAVPTPAWCDVLFVTVIAGQQGDVAIVYWAYNAVVGHPLVMLDIDLMPLAAALFDTIKARCVDLAKACRVRSGFIGLFASKALAEEAQRVGYPAESLDNLTAEIELLRLSAATHICNDRIKIAEQALARANYPLNGFLDAAIMDADQTDPVQIACLAGIALALDSGRSLTRCAG